MFYRKISLCLCVLFWMGIASAQTHAPIVNLPTADNNPAVTTGNQLAVEPHSALSTLDDPLGNVYPAGTTYYDLQHNGSAGKMLYIDQAGLVHLVWTKGFTSSLSGARHVMYQIWDPATSAMTFLTGGNPTGLQIDAFTRGGFITIGGHPSGWVFPAFHETRSNLIVAHSEGAIDYLPGLGAFTSTYPTLISPDGSLMSTIWPKIAVGADTIEHMLSEESPPSSGQPGYHVWQRLYYSRGVPEWDMSFAGVQVNWQPVAPGNAQYMLIDTITTISGEIAASKFSLRVAMAYTKPIQHNPDSMNQFNNDVIVRISENGGLSWGAPMNITQFAFADTQRAYTDVSLVFDESDVLHVAFTTAGYYADQNAINSVFSMIWHWDEASQQFSVMANSYGPTYNGDAMLGSWQRLIQRPSLSVDPTTGYLYSSYQGYDLNSWSVGGYYLADAFVTVSTNNGQSWTLATNLSNNNGLPPVPDGDCQSERDITLADRITYSNGTGYLNLSYVLDRSAGTAPQGEGYMVNNNFVYQRVPVNQIAHSPMVPNVPLHVGQFTYGRCCYESDSVETCAYVTHQVCLGYGGQWDSTLTCNTPCSTPPPRTGRCCYGDPQNPTCHMLPESICRNVAGRWDSSLTCNTPCPVTPPTLGRCCYGEDSIRACSYTTHMTCDSLAGQWDSTLTCNTPCPTGPPPTGRCCYGNPEQPACAMLTEDLCRRVGGSWNESLTCTTPCPVTPPYEARCCYGPDPNAPTCQMFSRSLCTAYAGRWDSLLTCDTPCPILTPPTGRCCYGYSPLSPYCAMLTQYLCDAIGGQWNSALNCETPCQDSVFCAFRDQQNVFCNTIGGAIPDANPSGTDFIIHVPTQYHITRLTAAIDITHPNDMDLIITLQSPAGHVSVLSSQQGAGGANYLCTVFDDLAFDSVAGGYPPYTGTWLPMTPLFVFNDENAMGDWILHVSDVYSGNVGWVNWACVHIEYDRILPVELMSFDVSDQSDGIHITFATASENNNARFEILRGTAQAGPFSSVASLASQGNSSSQQNYSFVDREVLPGHPYWYYLADVSLNGARTEHRDQMRTASISHNVIPTEFSLSVYPNPFNPATTIQFSLTEASLVRLTFYDLTGRSIGTPLEKKYEAGVYHQNFDGSGLPAGVYFVRIDTGHFSKTLKMLLLK